MNKRKALIGWLVYSAIKPIAKRAVKQKAKAAVPSTRKGSRMPNTAAIVAGIGAVAGALLFWRKKSDDDSSEPSES